MRSLEGSVALITGASRGIGRAMALAFGQAGALVAVTARTPPALEAVVSAVRDSGSAALAIPADLSLEADIQRIADTALSHFGRLDILVNNAGIVHPRVDLVDFDPTLWRQVIKVNLVAAALLTKAVLPGMIAHRSGKILNVSSIGGPPRWQGEKCVSGDQGRLDQSDRECGGRGEALWH